MVPIYDLHTKSIEIAKRITFTSNGDTLVGALHVPDGTIKGTVVLTGPLTSVKEQAAGAYATALSQKGYAALSFDHRHFGESGGAPRQYESPDQKIADIRVAAQWLKAQLPDLPLYAVGIRAGAGYMAGAVAKSAQIDAFAGVAGFYPDAAQTRAWMGNGFDAAIASGTAAREVFEKTDEAAIIPAVAQEGDRAMPMDEAFEYYGTERGGEATFKGYKNAVAIMSKEKTTPYDAMGVAPSITQPTLLIHSENALSPMLARRFYDALAAPKKIEWVESIGQIDFYDDPARIDPAAAQLDASFEATGR